MVKRIYALAATAALVFSAVVGLGVHSELAARPAVVQASHVTAVARHHHHYKSPNPGGPGFHAPNPGGPAMAAASVPAHTQSASPRQPSGSQYACYGADTSCTFYTTLSGETAIFTKSSGSFTKYKQAGDGELQQAGTSNCATLNATKGLIDEAGCNNLLSQQWSFGADGHIISGYNGDCWQAFADLQGVVAFQSCSDIPAQNWSWKG